MNITQALKMADELCADRSRIVVTIRGTDGRRICFCDAKCLDDELNNLKDLELEVFDLLYVDSKGFPPSVVLEMSLKRMQYDER